MKSFRIELLDTNQTILYTRIERCIEYSDAENLAKWYLVATIATSYKITEL